MAKKKSVKKAVKKSIKKPVKKKVSKKTGKYKKFVLSIHKKMDIALRRFAFFATLFIVTLVLYKLSTQDLYENLFGVFSAIFGFVSLAFLVIILIFFFLRFLKK